MTTRSDIRAFPGRWRISPARWGLAAAFWVVASVSAPAAATDLRVLFSPWDDAEGAIIAVLSQARQEIRVQAYLLTSRAITGSLLAAHRRHIDVAVLADGKMAESAGRDALTELAASGIPVWLDTRYAAAHNKVIVVDARTATPVVMTGSYNFTWSAQARNAENLLIITGDQETARRYRDNWERHRGDAVPYDPQH